jgi:hypothetical protein
MIMSVAQLLEKDSVSFVDISVAKGVGGPRTLAGKQTVARNSLRHGLTGRNLLLPEDDARVAQAREAGLKAEFDPKTENEEILIKKMAVASVRSEVARGLQLKRRAELVERAANHWGDDQQIQTLELAKKLPHDPETISLKLLSTPRGVQWLMGRWSILLRHLEKGYEWTSEQRSMALDLIGYPLEFRDPCAYPIDANDAATRKKLRMELAHGQLDALCKMMDDRREQRDADAQQDAIDGYTPLNDRELNLYRRYEREADRLYMACLREFRSGRKAEKSTTTDLTKQTVEQTIGMKIPSVPDLPAEESEELSDEDVCDEQNLTDPDASVQPAPAPDSTPDSCPIKGNRRQRRARAARLRKIEKEIKKLSRMQNR